MLLNDQYVTIEYFKDRDERKPEAHPQHQGNNLFIKNLDCTIDDECLRTVFGEFGTVMNAKVMTENGLSKGFGFVSFTSSQDAMTAKNAVNGRMWGRKQVYVRVALRKGERQAQLEHQKAQNMFSLQNNVQLQQPVLPPSEDLVQADPAITTDFTEDNNQAVSAIETAPSEDSVSVFETAPCEDIVPDFKTAPAIEKAPVEAPAALSDTVKAKAADEESSTSVANVDDVQLDDSTKDAPTSTPSGKRLTIYMLESAPLDDQIQMAYDYMLPLVEKILPPLASKITWMLIEGENNFEIMNMISVPELLCARVHEMDSLLKAREAGHKPETLKMLYRHKSSRNRKKKNNKNKRNI
ncbi:polyadenylate-binding protein 1-like, partial [Tachysurus ichikawai]